MTMNLADICRRWPSLTDLESFEDFPDALAGLRQRRETSLREALRSTEWEFQPRDGECVFSKKSGSVEIKITKVDFAGWQRRSGEGGWTDARKKDFHPRECQQLQGVAQDGLRVLELELDKGQLPGAILQFRAKLDELLKSFQTACDREQVIEAEERLRELADFYEEYFPHNEAFAAKNHRTTKTLPRKSRRQILGVWHRWLTERLSKANGGEQVQVVLEQLSQLRRRYRSDVCIPCPREALAEKAVALIENFEAALRDNLPEIDARQALESHFKEYESVLETQLRSQMAQALSRSSSTDEPPPCLCPGCQEYASLQVAEQFATRLSDVRSASSRAALEEAWQQAYSLAESHGDMLAARYELKSVSELKARLQAAFDYARSHNFAPDPPAAFCASQDLRSEIVLRWQRSTGTEKYILRRLGGAGTTSPPALVREVQDTGEDAMEFTDTLVTAGLPYQFWITARNQFGESSPSGPAQGMAAIGTKSPPQLPPEDTIRIPVPIFNAGTKAERAGDVFGLVELYGALIRRDFSPRLMADDVLQLERLYQSGEIISVIYDYLAGCLIGATGKLVRDWEEKLTAATALEDLNSLEHDRERFLKALNDVLDQEKRIVPLTSLKNSRELAHGFMTNLASGRKAFKFAAHFLDKLRAASTAEQAEQRRLELESWELRELGGLPALNKELSDALVQTETRIKWVAEFRERAGNTAQSEQIQVLQSELDAVGNALLTEHPKVLSELQGLLKKRSLEHSDPGQRAKEFALQFRATVDKAETADLVTDLRRQLGAANVGVLAGMPDLQKDLANLVEGAHQRVEFVARFLQSADTTQARDELSALERLFDLGTSQCRLAPETLRRIVAAKEAAQKRVNNAEENLRRRIFILADHAWRTSDLAAGKAVLLDPVHARLLRGNPPLQQQLELRLSQAGQTVVDITAFLKQLSNEVTRAFSGQDMDGLRELIRNRQRLWSGKDGLTAEIEGQAETALQQVQRNEQELRARVETSASEAWQSDHLIALETLLQEPGPRALASGNKTLNLDLIDCVARSRGEIARVEQLISQVAELAEQASTDEGKARLQQLIASQHDLLAGKPGLSERLESIVDSVRRRTTFLQDLAARARLVFSPEEMGALHNLVLEHQALLDSDTRRMPDGQTVSAHAVMGLLTQASTQIGDIGTLALELRDARTPTALAAGIKKIDAPPFSNCEVEVRERLSGLLADAEARIEFAARLVRVARATRKREQINALRTLWEERPSFAAQWETDLEAEIHAAEKRANASWLSSLTFLITLGAAVLLAAAGAWSQFWPAPTPKIDRFPKDATREHPWTNSLGMNLVPVPMRDNRTVLFCVWETRVKDFNAFVTATGHDATAKMTSLRADGHRQRGDSWRQPGFTQTPMHPVCGVEWDDAKKFCIWLTSKERKEGRLTGSQEYRLPTDAEWSAAVGIADRESPGSPKEKDGKLKDVYPWGNQWPPPPNVGNYAGQEATTNNWPSDFKALDGYRDEFFRTAPVGSFAANPHGLHDLGGNVWELCEDWYDASQTYRLLRGGAWNTSDPGQMLSSYRGDLAPGTRHDFVGFRVVLVEIQNPK